MSDMANGEDQQTLTRRDNNNRQRDELGLPIYSQDPPGDVAVPDCDKLDTRVPEGELADFLKSDMANELALKEKVKTLEKKIEEKEKECLMLKEQIKQLQEEPQRHDEHQAQQQLLTRANKRKDDEGGDQERKRQKGEDQQTLTRRDNNNRQRDELGLPIYSQDPPGDVAVPDCDKL